MSALSRRDFLRYGSLAGAVAAGIPLTELLAAGSAAAATVRKPGSRPFPKLPVGHVNAALPFDHVVVVMMENHSFDNYLGALSRHGQPHADGLTFSKTGASLNHNPGTHGRVHSHKFATTAQSDHVTQTWNATHRQVNGGRMDGFVAAAGNSAQAMGYWGPDTLPFAYSFAKTFTPPPRGTIFDKLHSAGVSWKNYYTDLPQTAIIPSIIKQYRSNLASIAEFFADCAAGTLPSVSFVDPEFGALSEIGGPLVGVPGVTVLGQQLEQAGGDEEAPQDMAYGENWAYFVVDAVLKSPAWERTLLIYTFEEHGGYYDRVPPPAALKPDEIEPDLTKTDTKGSYDRYGPRVRRSSPRRKPAQTPSPTSSTTTRRCSRRSSPSGTCRRSRIATRTPRPSWISSI